MRSSANGCKNHQSCKVAADESQGPPACKRVHISAVHLKGEAYRLSGILETHEAWHLKSLPHEVHEDTFQRSETALSLRCNTFIMPRNMSKSGA